MSHRCLHFFSSSICWKTKYDLIFIEVKYVLFLKTITTTKKPASSERLTEVGSQMDLTAGGSRGWVTPWLLITSSLSVSDVPRPSFLHFFQVVLSLGINVTVSLPYFTDLETEARRN